jgi:hypothetical protein
LAEFLKARLTAIENEADGEAQESKLVELAASIRTEDIPSHLFWLKEHTSLSLAADLSKKLVRRWVGTNPAAAADWVVQNLSGSIRQEALSDVAVVWGNQDLTNAVAWARQLPQGEAQPALTHIAYEAVRTEPVTALTLAVELPATKSRDDLLTHAAREWSLKAPETAAAWAAQVPDAGLRERLLVDIATTWGEQDPASAASLAVKALSQGKRQDDAVVGIVQRWVQKEPEAAATWVSAFPEGTLRDTAMENVVKLWADQDRDQTGEWLNRMEAGASRDLAVGVYVKKLAPTVPAMAAQWVEGIGDEALRLQGMEAVGESWMATDAAAARAWITQSALPETIKARLLSK